MLGENARTTDPRHDSSTFRLRHHRRRAVCIGRARPGALAGRPGGGCRGVSTNACPHLGEDASTCGPRPDSSTIRRLPNRQRGAFSGRARPGALAGRLGGGCRGDSTIACPHLGEDARTGGPRHDSSTIRRLPNRRRAVCSGRARPGALAGRSGGGCRVVSTNACPCQHNRRRSGAGEVAVILGSSRKQRNYTPKSYTYNYYKYYNWYH
jgi:hypothetical protein